MKFTKALTVLTASVAVVAGTLVASPAYADEPASTATLGTSASVTAPAELSPELVSQARDELVQAKVPVERSIVGTEMSETFTLEDGTQLRFSSSVISSRLGGGVHSKYGIYVEFNKLDQQALIAGGGVALGAAICAIPAVGWAACAVVGTIIAIATTYIAANGLCGGNRQLRVYMQLLGNPQCI